MKSCTGNFSNRSKNCGSRNFWTEEGNCMFNNRFLNGDVEDEKVVHQFASMQQDSDELICIRNSCHIKVDTTDTQVAISLQVALQLTIALIISISLGSTEEGQSVAQELFKVFDDVQSNKQKIYIDNCKDVEVVTVDTDLTANVQALLEVLGTLTVNLDI